VKVATQQGAPTIQATILDTQRSFTVDTGSNVSLIKADINHSRIMTTNLAPMGVTGNELEIVGVQDIEFWCNNRKYCHPFCVCSLPTDVDGIIGMDFLAAVNAKLDLERQQLRMLRCKTFDHDPSNPRARGTSRMANCLALTVFSSDGQENRKKAKTGIEAPRKQHSQNSQF
jgi:hypothetical protein